LQARALKGRFVAEDLNSVAPARSRARLLFQPWLLATVACVCSYALLWTLGLGGFRSEFLGASVMAGVLGGLLLVVFRVFSGPAWLHGLGVFCLHWLFAAYALSLLAL
jgi:hypothetical protein